MSDLIVSIKAQASNFKKAAKDVRQDLGGIQDRAKGASRSLKSMGDSSISLGKTLSARVTAPMAAATAGIGALISKSANAAKEIQNLANLSNTSTTEFQELAFAAQSVGVEQDKVGDILKDVNDKVGDFLTTGGGPLKDFFDDIAPKVGVTADEFRGLSGKESLQLFVNTLEEAGAGTQEMTFQMEALASDATALLPILRNNGQRLQELGDKAQRTGAILSEDTITASVEASRKMDQLKANASALTTQLGASLLPIFNRFAGFMQRTGIPAIKSMIDSVSDLFDWFGQLPGPVKRAAGIMAGVLGAGGPIMIAIGVLSKALGTLVAATGPIGLFIAAATTVVTAWRSSKGDLGDITSSIAESFGAMSQNIGEAIGDIAFDLTQKIKGAAEDSEGSMVGLAEGANNAITDMRVSTGEALGNFVFDLVDGFERGRKGAVGEAEQMKEDTTEKVKMMNDFVITNFGDMEEQASRETDDMRRNTALDFSEIKNDADRKSFLMQGSVLEHFEGMASGAQESTDKICASINDDFRGCASDAEAIAGLMQGSVLDSSKKLRDGFDDDMDEICKSVNSESDGFQGCASDAEAIAGLMAGSVLESSAKLRRGVTGDMEDAGQAISKETEDAREDAKTNVSGMTEDLLKLLGEFVGKTGDEGGGWLGDISTMTDGTIGEFERLDRQGTRVLVDFGSNALQKLSNFVSEGDNSWLNQIGNMVSGTIGLFGDLKSGVTDIVESIDLTAPGVTIPVEVQRETVSVGGGGGDDSSAGGAIGTGIGTAVGGPVGGAIGGFIGDAIGGLFADGGAVTGPTVAMVGESRDVNRSNPEFIGTADQLQGMMGGNQPIQVNLNVSGKTMEEIVVRGNQKAKRRGRT